RASAVAAALLAVLVAACGGGGAPARPAPTATDTPVPQRTEAPAARAADPARDWTQFGYDAAKTNHAPRGISPAGVARRRQRRVALPGTVDSSPIYLAGVRVRGAERDVMVMTTTY